MRITLLLLFCILVFPLLASVVPLSLEEQIRGSEAIVDVTVTGKTTVEKGLAKFVYTRYSFEVHETLLGSNSRELSLDFGGGSKGDIRMVAGEVPSLIVGARYLLILEETHNRLISPIVGSYQGLYQAVPTRGGQLAVHDAGGSPILSNSRSVSYSEFLIDLRTQIPSALSKGKLMLPTTSNSASAIQLPSKVWDDTINQPYTGNVLKPGHSNEPQSRIPVPYEPVYQNPPIFHEPEIGGDRLAFFAWWQPLPCTFNQLVGSDTFSPHDVWQMAKWNDFVDMFRIFEFPVASWAYGNNRNDVVGVVNDSTYNAIFGGHWGSTTLAMWFGYVQESTHRMIESDVVFNGAYTWSLDNYATYNNPGFWPFDQVALHELGHAVGAPHNFGDLAVMNYAPKRYQSYNILYRDDTASARAAYSASDVTILNFAITSCRQNFVAGTTTTGIIPGNYVVLNGITIQNNGTQAGTASISFYLCATILSFENSIYLGNLTLQNFDANSESVLNDISYTVPAGTPPGIYNIGMLITTANDEIGLDNECWFHQTTMILPTPINGLWEGDVSSDWFDGQNWNDGNVPTINSTVTIPAATLYNPIIMNQYAQCFSLNLEPGASLSLIDNFLEVNGNFINSGTVYLFENANQVLINGSLTMNTGSSMISLNPLTAVYIGGNLTVEDGANISSMQGRIEFFGTEEANLTIYDADTTFNSLMVNKFNSSLTYSGNSTVKLAVMGNLGLGSYTTLRLESSQNTEVYGNLTGSDTSALIATAGKLKMCGSGTQTIQVPDLYSYLNHLEIACQGTVSSVYDLTIKGDLIISLGVFEAPYNIYINGHWNNTLGPDAFTEGLGSVTFQGEDHQYCTTENFNRLVINKNYGALRLLFANITCNSYAYGSGAVDLLFGNFIANDLEQDGIYGNFYMNPFCRVDLYQNAGNYVDLNGTINMIGGEFHVHCGSTTSWWGYSSPATLNMLDGLVYFHDQGIEIPASGATLNITGGTIRTDGSFSLGIDGFMAPNWTLYMSGSQDTGLWLNNLASLNHLVIDKSSGRESNIQLRNHDGSPYPQTRENAVYANTNLRIYGNFSLNSGSFHAPSLIEVKGIWAGNPAATFDANGGRILFTGDQLSQIALSCGFYDLEISKLNDGIGVQLAANLNITVDHNLVISDGVLGVSGYNALTVGGDLSILAGAGLNLSGEAIQLSLRGDVYNLNAEHSPITGFYAGSSLVLLEGTQDQVFNSGGYINFHDLRINTYNGANLRPSTAVGVHDLEIINGGYYSTETGLNISIYGDFYVHYNGRWWDHANTVVFMGSEEQTIRIDAPADSCWFDYITVDKHTRSEGGRSQNVCLLSDLNLRNHGGLVITNAVLDLNGHKVSTTGYVDVGNYGTLNLPPESVLELGQGLYVRSNGNLNIAGSQADPVLIGRLGYTWPFFQVENYGHISAEWGNFEYLNMSGVNIMPGAIVDPLKAFNHCSFLNGQAGGSALTLNDSGTYTATGVNFGNNGWGSGYNVTKTVDQGEVIFASCQGSFSGPAFENDAYGHIQWSDFIPDLVVTTFSWSTYTPETGDVISASVTVRNDGNFTTSGGFWIDLYKNRTSQPQFGDPSDWQQLATDLAPGDSLTMVFDNISVSEPQEWRSWVIADGTQAVNEFSEANNLAGPLDLAWTTPALPNLMISYAGYNSSNPYVGQQISLTVSITNTSDVSVNSPVDIDLYFDPATPPDGSVAGDLAYTFDSIPAGQTVFHTFSGISNGLAEVWQSSVLLDRTSLILESNETDNAANPDPVSWQTLPEPANVSLSYDPVTGLATLSWDHPLPSATFSVYWDPDPSGTFINLLETTPNHQISFVPAEAKAFYLIKAEN